MPFWSDGAATAFGTTVGEHCQPHKLEPHQCMEGYDDCFYYFIIVPILLYFFCPFLVLRAYLSFNLSIDLNKFMNSVMIVDRG